MRRTLLRILVPILLVLPQGCIVVTCGTTRRIGDDAAPARGAADTVTAPGTRPQW